MNENERWDQEFYKLIAKIPKTKPRTIEDDEKDGGFLLYDELIDNYLKNKAKKTMILNRAFCDTTLPSPNE